MVGICLRVLLLWFVVVVYLRFWFDCLIYGVDGLLVGFWLSCWTLDDAYIL